MRLSVGGENPEYPVKTTDLPKITDNMLSHNVVSSTPRLSGIPTHNFSGDSTDCTCSCKSNYHAIMITTVPGSNKSNWWIPRNEQELLIVPEHLSSLPVLVASVLIDL
jgi:hypothetical protein